jgi:hypothetical protein
VIKKKRKKGASTTTQSEEVELEELGGGRWVQPAFKYQSKCLATLREGFTALAEPEQAWVRAALAGTGCEVLLVHAASRL